jgi:hypothetical protein
MFNSCWYWLNNVFMQRGRNQIEAEIYVKALETSTHAQACFTFAAPVDVSLPPILAHNTFPL